MRFLLKIITIYFGKNIRLYYSNYCIFTYLAF